MGSSFSFPPPPEGFDVNAFLAGHGFTVKKRDKSDSLWAIEIEEIVSDKMKAAIVEFLLPKAAGLPTSGRFDESPDGSILEKTIDDLGIISTDKVT